eukprot:scpid97152/ scgid33087/ 
MGRACHRAEGVGRSAYTESRRWSLESRRACKRLSRQQETMEQVSRRLETRRLREKMQRQQETAEQASSRQEKRHDLCLALSIISFMSRTVPAKTEGHMLI